MTSAQKSRLKERVVHEAQNFAMIFVYVWVFMSLFVLHKALLLGRSPLYDLATAVLNAFVLAKFILILDFFNVGDSFKGRAPIFRILVKALLYGLVLLGCNVLEEGIRGWMHGKAFGASLSQTRVGSAFGLVIMAIITTVALMPYLICMEISRVIGKRTLTALIFRRPAATGAVPL